MSAQRDLEVQVSLAEDETTVDAGLLEAAVRRTWEEDARGGGAVSVTLLDDEGIAELNRTYLDRDGPTDVIAFTLGDASAPVGDVYLGAGQAARQATEYGVSLVEELVRLTVHGTLHVLGYDHPEGAERATSPMFLRQEALVRAVMEEARRV